MTTETKETRSVIIDTSEGSEEVENFFKFVMKVGVRRIDKNHYEVVYNRDDFFKMIYSENFREKLLSHLLWFFWTTIQKEKSEKNSAKEGNAYVA